MEHYERFDLKQRIEQSAREAAELRRARIALEESWAAVASLGPSFTDLLVKIRRAEVAASLELHAAESRQRTCIKERDELDAKVGSTRA